MKKCGFMHRALAMLLAAVLVLQVLPMGALALEGAKGDYNTGDTGIVNSSLGQGGTISWPIKIYDYLNDGMLFEFAEHADTTPSVVYGGGAPVPVPDTSYYKAYTTSSTLPSSYAGNGEGRLFTRRAVEAVDFTTPKYMRITRKATSATYRNTTLINLGAYVKVANIRYVTLVYRSKGIETGATPAQTIQLNTYNRSGGWNRVNVKQNDQGTWTNSPDTWQYLIVDLVNDSAGLTSAMSIESLYLREADTLESGDYLDIAYIACYSDESKAEQFGMDAVEFCNEPGEYLRRSKTINVTASDSSTVSGKVFPYASVPNFRFTPRHVYNTQTTSMTHGNGDSTRAESLQTNIYHGLNFTLAKTNSYEYFSAYSTNTYATWKTQSTIATDAYSGGITTTKLEVTETEQTSQGQKYVNIKNTSTNTEENRILLMNLREDYGDGMAGATNAHHNVVLIYRTHNLDSSDKFGFWAYGGQDYNATANFVTAGLTDATNWQTSGKTTPVDFNGVNETFGTINGNNTEDVWVYQIVNFSDMIKACDPTNMNKITYVKHIGLYLPALTGDKSIDLAYVGFFGDNRLTQAETFAKEAIAYMNSNLIFDENGNQTGVNTGTSGSTGNKTVTLSGRGWNTIANNKAFGMFHASQGGGRDSGGDGGADNGLSNGYPSYRIGYNISQTDTSKSGSYYWRKKLGGFDAYYFDDEGIPTMPETGKTNHIFYVNATGIDGISDNGGFDISHLDFDGYQLLNLVTSMGMTAGLLESTLVDGRPVYRQETVEYIAEVLYYTLVIPPFDADGDYNYNYVQGSKSTLFALDLNGDGDLDDKVDLNGDNYAETSEAKMDLATALRHCLGVKFTIGQNKGTFARTTGAEDSGMGTYAATEAKAHGLIGSFANCRGNIRTCMDAAYFLLNNLFVENSYNQPQNDYGYLVLSHATMDSGKQAYVFDAGFGTGQAGVGENTNVDSSYTSQSSVQYSPFQAENGNGTISLGTVGAKDIYFFTTNAITTRFPFLPVTDAEGDFAGQTKTPYFVDNPGVMSLEAEGETYVGRNYNYVMQANGEFLFDVEDELFFEFEGDDDVYLFINDELVLDIGGAHACTNVAFNMNDYVNKAQEILSAKFTDYHGSLSTEAFEDMMTAAGLTDEEKVEYRRWHKLNLQDGQTYAIDFYYMERHGTGANCRIVTNIIMSDPSLQTDKTAYQNGNEIAYGGAVNVDENVEYSFKLTNEGNSKLYNLTFTDNQIGVALTYTGGLTIESDKAGKVKNAAGDALRAQDLLFTITGYYDEAKTNPTTPIVITGLSNDELKQFLTDLTTPGNETQFGEGGLFSGSGLWRHATLAIRGIYFDIDKSDLDQTNTFKNTVYITAMPATNSSQVIKGETNHLVRVPADPMVFYQWAGHELGIHREYIFNQLIPSNKETFSTMSSFFMDPCRADGTSYTWPDVKVDDQYDPTTDGYDENRHAGNQGTLLTINYQEPGRNLIYLKLYRSKPIEEFQPEHWNEYVIVPIIIYVTDVEDSTTVLDYGLKVELTGDGGIFANDSLQPHANAQHKVMGITEETPAYWKYYHSRYLLGNDSRINFTPDEDGVITSKTDTASDGAVTTTDFDGSFTLENDKLYFTPTDFMDAKYSVYTAVSVYDAGFTPSPVGPLNVDTNGDDKATGDELKYTIDIAKEVQMFKKITVLPATVVYYEDDFAGIIYTNKDGANFERVGSGSGSLTQSVDQSMPYGYDDSYKTATEYSGNSLTKIKISDNLEQARFSFTGTGFELISRTNAKDSSTIIVQLYDRAAYDAYLEDPSSAKPAALKTIPVITEFNNGSDGGEDAIYQVPVIRVKDMERSSYTVVISGIPRKDWSTTPATLKDTYLYIDGLRIYQPLGSTNSVYSVSEKNAQFHEIRDLVTAGKAAVIQFNGFLEAYTGTTTWTEDLHNSFEGNKVTSSNDYMIAGPNNELYMDGTVSNSAVVFYVEKDTSAATHGLQVAVRALDYAAFYAANDDNHNLNAKVQYGVKNGSEYTWKDLAIITTGTEQYYTIPYADCPYVQGCGYQVVLRAVEVVEEIPVMVSYTTLKTVGLDVQQIDGNGEPTILKYENGILLNPTYYLCTTDGDEYKFENGVLTLTVTEDMSVSIRRDITSYSNVDENGNPKTTSTTYGAFEVDEENSELVFAKGSGANFVLDLNTTFTFELKQYAEDQIALIYTATVEGEDVEAVDEKNGNLLNLYTLRAQMAAETSEETQVPGSVSKPTLELAYPKLNLESEVMYNIYYSVSDMTDVVEMGLITFSERLENGTIEDALEVIPGHVYNGEHYMVHTNGIVAKNLGDMVFFRVYAKLSDGSYAYTDTVGYNATLFVKDILRDDTSDPNLKSTLVALMNYGAAAQQYFGYKTDSLMNTFLTDAQQALVDDYRADMVPGLGIVDSGKVGSFADNQGYSKKYPKVTLGGAFSINYYFTPSNPVDSELKLYYWTTGDYEAAEVLTADNATGVVTMSPVDDTSAYYGVVDGISAKHMGEAIYVAGVYESDGVSYCTGVIPYSLAAYCLDRINKGSDEIKPVASAIAVYGYYARNYFANL